jgi:hypothetical protein
VGTPSFSEMLHNLDAPVDLCRFPYFVFAESCLGASTRIYLSHTRPAALLTDTLTDEYLLDCANNTLPIV